MDKNNIPYVAKCEGENPGYTVEGFKEKKVQLDELKKSATVCANKVQEFQKAGDLVAHRNAVEKFGEYKDQIDTLERAILSGDAFVDRSVNDLDYISDASIFSLREFCGGSTPIDANTVRVPMDLYNDTTIAESVAEGADSTPRQLTDVMSVLHTDTDDVIIFNDTAKVSESLYNDDSKTFRDAIKNSHTRAVVNAENKKALELLVHSKEAIAFTADTILEKINAALCGKAKRNAVIITNKNGFASLDTVDANGYPLLKKNNAGEFVLLEKYVVIEMDNEILPNNENDSAPVIVGDIANVVKFFTIKETNLISILADFSFNVSSRSIKKEIIKLRTTSDEAFIVGSI